MRFAIPVGDEGGLDSYLFEHFGHAPYFLLIDITDGEITSYNIIKNYYENEHGPGFVPKLLAEHDVDVLICRGIGRRAVEYFDSLGIEVISGAYGCVKDVIDMFLKGLLKSKEYTPRKKWGEE